MADSNELHIEFKLDGKTAIPGTVEEVETKHGGGMRRIQVDQRLDAPDFFSVEFHSTAHKDNNLVDAIKPGAKVEIGIGYENEAVIFNGEVSYIEPHFDAREQWITVSGYDKSHRLTRGTSSRTFGDGHQANVDAGSILGDVVGGSKSREQEKSDGLSASTGAASEKVEYISQYNQNDYQFIQQVTGNFGFGWDNKSYEKADAISLKAIEKGSPVCNICRDKYDPSKDSMAISADFRLSTVRQAAKVEVRGWDPLTKKALKGESKDLTFKIGGGSPGKEQAGKAHYESGGAGRVVTIVDLPVRSTKEAEEIAKSILDKLSMDWMTADIVIEGRPDIHAGDVVKVVDFGKRFDGEYLVEGLQHVWIAGSGQAYRCYLKLARNMSPEP